MIRTYSNEQRAVFREILSSDRNIAIHATAGGGKTTTLTEAARMLPPSASAVFLAFNKSIVEELAGRLPEGFECMTLHSLGLKTLYRHYGSGVRLSDGKYYGILKKVLDGYRDDVAEREYNALLYMLLERWDWYRMTLDKSLLEADPRGVVEDRVWLSFLRKAEKVNGTRPRRGGTFEVDFVDMIYLPVTLRLRTPQWSHVLIDESQDFNICQHELVEKIIAPGGRLVSVGDEEQCIYAFAGASPESFRRFASRPNTVELPLSVTWRCAKKIVAHARQYSGKITAHPAAPDGVVREGTLDEVRPGDFVLCRNNAPLLETYFNLLAEGRKAYVLGHDTRDVYLRMAKLFERSHLQAMLDYWHNQLEELHERLAARGIRRVERIESYQKLEERIRGLEIIADRCTTVTQVIRRIEQIFEPSKDAIVLSTVHKSKGLEANRVFLLRWDLMFSRCETEEEFRQERNLAFVAVTRAKTELVYVMEPEEEEDPDKPDPEED